MKILVFIGILPIIIGVFTITSAGQNNLSPEIREMARRVMMPVVYKVEGMDKVKVFENLKYTKSDDANILMDVYQPPNLAKTEKRPAVIFIHGGVKTEYTPKDWGFFTSWGRLIAASNFVGVTFTHRLEYPNKSLENAAEDVREAIAYIRANADKYNVDRDRICLIAFSAGGPLLTMAMRGETPFVKCVVGFYSFLDIRESAYKQTEDSAALNKFSAITYLETGAKNLPPIFIARAGRDEIPTMNDSIDRFIKEAISKNIALNFANHPNGVHSFDNQTNDERSREIVREAIEFMKIHLENKPAKK
jgi:acetyl esterase/lipase